MPLSSVAPARKTLTRRARLRQESAPPVQRPPAGKQNRLAWCDYFSRLAGSLRARAEEYDHRAQALMEQSNRKEQRNG